MNEDEFVDVLIELTGGPESSPIGDDCAVLETPPSPLLATVDTMVRAVHYDPDADPLDVGRKLAAVNVSDVAAMGGRPSWALLSLASGRPPEQQRRIAEGTRDRLGETGTGLVGGDLSHTREPAEETLSLTVLGRASPAGLLRRSRARPGDRIAVTGPLGGARAVLEAGTIPRPEGDRRILYDPPNRVEAGVSLVESGVACGMDVSDGLTTDLSRILRSSGVGARLDPTSVPIHPRARQLASERDEALLWALEGGEDFELLVTLPPGLDRDAPGVSLHEVGRVVEGEGLRWDPPLPSSLPRQPRGYDHFREGS